ncbi:hypothetical protein LMG26857_03617 [Achromobacter anxifer]|uniref:hypothetical protein n=1 Tax=Achromobacter anxifer TaxID=1287737 RepID=UPI00155D38A3|nr:hypothetical protein [Achromobacter anxifer]CAB5514558.1 hypothetical protein LMG26857_03617 [Achromobacter anxifer]
MTKPAFITFTGADHHTCIDGMIALSKRYPIEWGILFSPFHQGTGRYPVFEWVNQLRHRAKAGALTLSAHICGGYSRKLIKTGACEVDVLLPGVFQRAQINTADPKVDPAQIQAWARAQGVVPILQARGGFPAAQEVQWLLDESGGRGVVQESWPAPAAEGILHGYAGGLGPENVAQAVQHIGQRASTYWIDMESRLRDEQDRFDLARCRAVCEAVYGR